MPHRDSHFVLAYQWDHHCHDIFESLRGRFHHMLRELGELEHQDAADTLALLNYFKKWHYNRDLYEHTIKEIDRRQGVINSLGYRGYGVNIELLNALGALKKDYAGHICWLLEERFKKPLEILNDTVSLTVPHVAAKDSGAIIRLLCEKLDLEPDENIPVSLTFKKLDLERYFRVMSHETSWTVNTAIFQKLFLHLGCSSNTIMKGSVGHENTRSPQELKIIGTRNFIKVYKETFSSLHKFTDIGIDLLKRIHKAISTDLVPNAGDFRTHDFPDRNGVTFEFNNFDREIKDLTFVLSETSQSFHDLDRLLWDLSRSYYMLIAVHPFWDSNGRVGKCFINHLLIKKGVPPISFDNTEEVLALPRYGGGMEDMHEYLKKRILAAVDAWFYERWKIEEFSLLDKQIYNVSFDAGFFFRQIDDQAQKLEVSFTSYLVERENPLFSWLEDRCLPVFPEERHIWDMTVYCGFSIKERGDWAHVFNVKNSFFIKEIPSDIPGARAFDVDFTIELQGYHYEFKHFNCCIVSHEAGIIHNNKGLNYSHEIMK
jgi:fido (protein-threonine AMPylation protein)